MQAYLSLIPFLYLFVAVPYTVMGLYAWSRRPAVAVTPFAWMMVAIAAWSFLYALELFTPHLQLKVILTNLQYPGIVSIPLFLLGFALEYTGRRHLLSRRIQALLWIIPIVIILATWTNRLHGLMWDSEQVEYFHGLTLLAVRMGPLFWVNIGYTYLLLFIGTLILIMELIQRPGIYRFQVSLVVLGLLSPWVGSLFYVFRFSPIPNLDLSPLFFIPSSFALAWAITRFRLLDVIPLEHVNVLQNMRDGVIVLDPQRRILYINPIGEFMLAKKDADAIGQPLNEISPAYARILTPYLDDDQKQFEFTAGDEADSPVFEVTISHMRLAPEPLGFNHVIIFHDISVRKEAEALLNRREAIMEAISFAAEQFLREPLWEHAIPRVLEKMGQATDVSRVYVAMNYTDMEGTLHSSLCYEWAAPELSKRIDDLRMLHMPLQKVGLTRWEECLGKGETIQGPLKTLPESERAL
ncbi:MAG: histidine kinase N-terminal 7TM domain-containing protein, partial [Chloroflexota bacterium]